MLHVQGLVGSPVSWVCMLLSPYSSQKRFSTVSQMTSINRNLWIPLYNLYEIISSWNDLLKINFVKNIDGNLIFFLFVWKILIRWLLILLGRRSSLQTTRFHSLALMLTFKNSWSVFDFRSSYLQRCATCHSFNLNVSFANVFVFIFFHLFSFHFSNFITKYPFKINYSVVSFLFSLFDTSVLEAKLNFFQFT